MATVVVTGATGAIGAATVAALQKRRAQVIGLSRPVLDLSSIASVRAAARELNRTAGHIDALLNIASVFTSRYQKSVDGFELMLATNHLGPFLLTNLLRDRLASGGRVITVTAPSTTQVNIDRLLDGLVRSDLMREAAGVIRFATRLVSRGPERAANDLADLALSPAHAGTSGWFFKGSRRIDPPKSSLDETAQAALWMRSADLVELEGGF